MKKFLLIILLFLLLMSGVVSGGCHGQRRTSGLPDLLPHSVKGYELYSWQTPENEWRYTLITGTNRQKTAEELVAGEDMQTSEGRVKLTVTGNEALLALLGRLPAGEQIFWRGAAAPAPVAAETGQFRLPAETVVSDVESRCRELELHLIIIANELEAVLMRPEAVTVGEPVPLTFTLINHARYPLYVLAWYTPLEGIAGEIFRVTRSGQSLPYEGILAMRGDPGTEDYILLSPGISVSATVDLAQAYDLTEPGTYTVSFLSPRISHIAATEAERAQTVDELGPVTIVSNTATVTVNSGD